MLLTELNKYFKPQMTQEMLTSLGKRPSQYGRTIVSLSLQIDGGLGSMFDVTSLVDFWIQVMGKYPEI